MISSSRKNQKKPENRGTGRSAAPVPLFSGNLLVFVKYRWSNHARTGPAKAALGEILFRNGGVAPHVVVTVNGHNIADFETSITELDVVAIFPPIAGG